MRHTLRRHWVTPDAFTLAISHDEHWKCVMCSVFWLPKEPVIRKRQSILVLPPSFSSQLCDDHVKVLGHGHTQSTNFEVANVKRCVIPLQLWRANLEQEHASTLLPPEPHPHQHICRTEFINSLRIEFISTGPLSSTFTSRFVSERVIGRTD